MGWIFVGVAVVGVFLPLLPTVPLLLLAGFCFERGSPELHAWLLQHPQFGPPLRDWYENRVIRPRAKFMSVSLISASVLYVWLYRYETAIWIKVLMTLVCAGAATYVVMQKSRVER